MRVAQLLPLANEDAAGSVRQKEAFVRVERDRIRALDARKTLLSVVAESERAAVCAVDVKPEPFVSAEIGDRAQRVDGSGVRRARGGDDEERREPCTTIGPERSGEKIG